MSTTPDFRQIILDELKSQGKTRRWLIDRVAGKVAGNTVYRYLRAELDMTSRPLAVLLSELGITIVPPRANRRRVG